MNPEWSTPTKYITGVGLVLLGIFVLYLSRPVIPLLILAALIAVIVRPVILWLHFRVRFPLGLAVAVTYLGAAILVPLALLLAVPAITNAVGYVISLDYPEIIRDILTWLRSTLTSIKTTTLPVAGLDSYVDRAVDSLLSGLQQGSPATAIEPPPVQTILQSLGTALTATFGAAADLVGAVFSQIALFIFMFLASIYISLGAHTYRSGLLRVVPTPYQPEIAILLARIERLWNNFFRGELTLMLVIGLISWVGLTVLGMPGALSLGIIAGLLELIPNLGPIIATIPAVIVALLQGSNYLPVSPLAFAGLVIIFYILVQQLENNLVVPRVLGDAVELPPLIVMTGVLVGATIGGILGALLATPIVATGRELLRYIYRKMQGEDPFPPEEALAGPAMRDALDLRQWWQIWSHRLANLRPAGSHPPAPDSAPPTESKPEP